MNRLEELRTARVKLGNALMQTGACVGYDLISGNAALAEIDLLRRQLADVIAEIEHIEAEGAAS